MVYLLQVPIQYVQVFVNFGSVDGVIEQPANSIITVKTNASFREIHPYFMVFIFYHDSVTE